MSPLTKGISEKASDVRGIGSTTLSASLNIGLAGVFDGPGVEQPAIKRVQITTENKVFIKFAIVLGPRLI
jgi:hypothetical protein